MDFGNGIFGRQQQHNAAGATIVEYVCLIGFFSLIVFIGTPLGESIEDAFWSIATSFSPCPLAAGVSASGSNQTGSPGSPESPGVNMEGGLTGCYPMDWGGNNPEALPGAGLFE